MAVGKKLSHMCESEVRQLYLNTSRFLHGHGVNIRHTGLLFAQVPVSNRLMRHVLLVDMVARVLKNLLRGVLRDSHAEGKNALPRKTRIVRFLNLCTFGAEMRTGQSTQPAHCVKFGSLEGIGT